MSKLIAFQNPATGIQLRHYFRRGALENERQFNVRFEMQITVARNTVVKIGIEARFKLQVRARLKHELQALATKMRHESALLILWTSHAHTGTLLSKRVRNGFQCWAKEIPNQTDTRFNFSRSYRSSPRCPAAQRGPRKRLCRSRCANQIRISFAAVSLPEA